MSKAAGGTRTAITIWRMKRSSYIPNEVRTIEVRETPTQYIAISMKNNDGQLLRISKKTGSEVGGDKYFSWNLQEHS